MGFSGYMGYIVINWFLMVLKTLYWLYGGLNGYTMVEIVNKGLENDQRNVYVIAI